MFSMVKKQNGPYFFSSPVLCTSFATVLTRQAALQSLSDSRPCRAPQSCREGSSREPLRSENLSGSVWAEGLQHPGMQQPAPPGVPALSHALSHWRAAQPSKSCQHGPICGGDPPPWILTVVMGWTGVWLQVTWPSCTRPHLSTPQMMMGGKQTGDKADYSSLRQGFTEKAPRPCHSLS